MRRRCRWVEGGWRVKVVTSAGCVQESLAASHCTLVTACSGVTSAQWCDLIYVLADGAVLECGAHQELWDARGAYWAMWRAANTARWQH